MHDNGTVEYYQIIISLSLSLSLALALSPLPPLPPQEKNNTSIVSSLTDTLRLLYQLPNLTPTCTVSWSVLLHCVCTVCVCVCVCVYQQYMCTSTYMFNT